MLRTIRETIAGMLRHLPLINAAPALPIVVTCGFILYAIWCCFEEDSRYCVRPDYAEPPSASELVRGVALMGTEHYPPDEHFRERYQRIVKQQDPPAVLKPASGPKK